MNAKFSIIEKNELSRREYKISFRSFKLYRRNEISAICVLNERKKKEKKLIVKADRDNGRKTKKEKKCIDVSILIGQSNDIARTLYLSVTSYDIGNNISKSEK